MDVVGLRRTLQGAQRALKASTTSQHTDIEAAARHVAQHMDQR